MHACPVQLVTIEMMQSPRHQVCSVCFGGLNLVTAAIKVVLSGIFEKQSFRFVVDGNCTIKKLSRHFSKKIRSARLPEPFFFLFGIIVQVLSLCDQVSLFYLNQFSIISAVW